ncbi:MAG: GNAT family N-acetyltransferase [Verrucomicrobiales bacterium]|nr:GNAT family N-acetyltransferase [Verrucomicrobiales bacterium]
MKEDAPSPATNDSGPDASEPPQLVSVVLATFSEDASRQLFRAVVVILVSITGTILLWRYSESLKLGLFLWIWLMVSVGGRLLRKRSIVVGNHDLRTIRGEIDQGIRWAGVGSLKVDGTEIELLFPEGGSRLISLRFLNPAIRDEAATAIIRTMEMFRHAGPVVIPLENEMRISSQRLELRPFEVKDVPFYVRLVTCPERMASQLSVMTSAELVAGSMTSLFKKRSQRNAYGMLVVWKHDTPIGIVYFRPTDLILRQAMLGFDLLPEYQNQGYGTEAVRAAIDYIERSSNLVKITAGTFSDNPASRRVLEKAGMTYIGTDRKFWFKGDHWKDGDRFEYLLNPEAVPASE